MSEKMKYVIWYGKALFWAIWTLRAGPKLAWDTVRDFDDYYSDGYSPKDALDDELSYWVD